MKSNVKILTPTLTTGMVRSANPTSNAHGTDISSWASLYGDRPPTSYLLFLMGTLAATITAGCSLWLYFPGIGAGQWFNAGLLNGGAAITIDSATGGYMQEVRLVGLATRMCVVGTWSAGVGSAACAPLEEV